MKRNSLVNASIIFIALILLVLVLKELESFLRPLAFSIIIVFLLMPLVRFSDKRKIPFWSVLTAVLILFGVFVYLTIFLVKGENQKINENLFEYQNQLRVTADYLNEKFSIAGAEFNIRDYLNAANLNKTIKSIVSAVGSLFSELFLAIIFTIFVYASHRKLLETIKKAMGRKDAKKLRSAIKEAQHNIMVYLYTKSLVSLGTALCFALLLWLFGSDFIFIIALLTFILNFIPNIGSLIAITLGVLSYALKFGPTVEAIWLGVLLVGIQVLFGNFIEPKFAGDQLKLSPIVIILSLFIWYNIWGIVGMMLAVPLMSIIKIILSNVEATKNWPKFLT